jgi:hypothetical protein
MSSNDMTMARCIGLGVALGIVFGVALHNYALGHVIGIAAGVLICLVRRRRERDARE